jgi:nitrite reductase/ring-hydroxylating ferredoxin subunit
MSHYVCKIEEIDENGKEVCLMAGQVPSYVMLFLHAGTISAYFNACPHQGRPLNWGPCRGARLRRLAVRLEGDSVWLDQELAPQQA